MKTQGLLERTVEKEEDDAHRSEHTTANEHLSGNPLVVESKAWCQAEVPEDNHLREPQDKEEEHQKR
jgi:hypothetical protein